MFTLEIDGPYRRGRGWRWRVAFLTPVLVLGACGSNKPATQTTPDAGHVPDGGDASPRDGADTGADAGADMEMDAASDGASGDPRIVVVTTTAPGHRVDGLCGLEEALDAISAGAGAGDCPVRPGADVIQLAAGTYAVERALELPRGLELRGAGRAATTLVLAGDARGCGLIVAAPNQTVKLVALTLAAPAAGGGGFTGACVENGGLWLRFARVTGFQAGGLRVQASGLDEGGGGDALAKLTLFNSLVDGNRNAGDGGGIAFVGDGSGLYVEQSAIVDNTSDGDGGGVFGSGGGLNTIKNSTLSGNRARRGGGIALAIQDQGYMALYSTTIADNHAGGVGGGVFQQAAADITVNTILNGDLISGNHADGDAAQDNLNADWGSNFTCTLSLFSVAALARTPPNIAGSCLYALADARLGPLMNMGGRDGLPVHALLPGSPAIDAIDATGSGEITQQRDSWNASAGDPQIGDGPGDTPAWTLFGRPEDGDGDGVAAEDMGSYEVNPRWEAELLDVAARSAGTYEVVTVPDGLSHGAAVRFSPDTPGDYIIYIVPVPEAGSYDVTATVRTAADGGRFQLAMAAAAGGPYTALGGEQDSFAAIGGALDVTARAVVVAGPGQMFIRVTVTGRNAASAGYAVTADDFVLTKP